ncbi:hypothetical protein H2198_001928 [Neophaeococcomyces mojaviensis]|uniref:Uncharacterized protein n=1 Tax=Neophaeococcomyces mojaviensis TaxID=3383035 RepID=A0ACC3AG78_9EURO|nr:hypothetical protein H2198_001928 [Knufia sp. JES_112]
MLFRKDRPILPLEAPCAVPHLGIPITNSTVDVRIINTTSYQRTKTANLYGKPVNGHENLCFPSYSFLITNKRQNVHILFDLGMRKDWRKSCPPELEQYISDHDPRAHLQVSVDTDVPDILDTDLGELGITSQQISAVVWSHHHFDHRGDMSRFPPWTRLIVGPGLIKTYSKELRRSDVSNREVIELTNPEFEFTVGGFPAHDAFGDGSLYILHCPGHTVGHLAALARVTSSPHSTYVLLGGDCAHHCGEFRPSPYTPLPQQIAFKGSSTGIWSFDRKFNNIPSMPSSPTFQTRKPMICAGEYIRDVVHPTKSAITSFYEAPPEPVVHSHKDACESLSKLELFDADDDVLVCISHDPALLSVLPFYPSTINEWHKKRYKQRLRWEFLNDFDLEDKIYATGRRL